MDDYKIKNGLDDMEGKPIGGLIITDYSTLKARQTHGYYPKRFIVYNKDLTGRYVIRAFKRYRKLCEKWRKRIVRGGTGSLGVDVRLFLYTTDDDGEVPEVRLIDRWPYERNI